MTPEERESAIRRIMALMAKTVEAGCSEEEAMAAADAVTRLMNKYQLDLSDIELRDSKCTKGKMDTRQKSPTAIRSVVTSIGYMCDVKVWENPDGGSFGGRAYCFFGLEHDVIVAEYLYRICDRAIIFGWEDHKLAINFGNLPYARKSKAKDEFQYGMAHRLAERLRSMKKTQKAENLQSTGRDLVVVKDAIVKEEWEKLGINLSKAKASKTVKASEDYHAGRAAGDRVSLNQGVGTNNSQRIG